MLLQPDNFTPASRTPWGGRRIVEQLKADLSLPVSGAVGEAWELSVEPDFQSRLVEGPTLDQVLRADPTLLGREAGLGSTALLIKLIDAANELSLQIHPRDADPALEDGESGKPEAWYIIDAEPGAGLYLGFRPGVSREDVRRAIVAREQLDELMTFAPVSAGDLVLIAPGTPHSIGRGVLLLESQRVVPGKRGITYRYWDWNRRYDPSGLPDPGGSPRELHVERALEITNWWEPRGKALIDRILYRSGPPAVGDDASLEILASPTGPLHSTTFVFCRLAGSGTLELRAEDRLRGLTVLEGRVTLDDGDTVVEVRRGRTAALPASKRPLRIVLDAAHAMLCTLA